MVVFLYFFFFFQGLRQASYLIFECFLVSRLVFCVAVDYSYLEPDPWSFLGTFARVWRF